VANFLGRIHLKKSALQRFGRAQMSRTGRRGED
jgi:hypothetical protein